MRLIDADVLKQHIDKLPALPDGNFAGNHSALKALINMQPTIEPSTNCSEIPNSSDSISRQAAIETLDEQIALCDKALKSFGISMKDEYAVKVERASLVAYKEQLEALPSADVAPVVHGKWIPHREKSRERWYNLHGKYSVIDHSGFYNNHMPGNIYAVFCGSLLLADSQNGYSGRQ